MATPRTVPIGDHRVGRGQALLVIAGPCVLEDPDEMFGIARHMAALCARIDARYVFKASFLKDNRTRGDSPRGPGLEAGVELLTAIGREVGCPVLTDVHSVDEVEALASAGIDVLQIPAFLSRQSRLLEAAGASGCVVNVKKGQFLAPEDLEHVAGKIAAAGGEKILLTERGTSFGYHDLVVDFRGFAFARDLGWPWIFDVTHSLQRPSGQGGKSGGTPSLAPMMARAATAAGVDGLFLEVHPEPARALSDASTQLPLDSVAEWLPLVAKLHADVVPARDAEAGIVSPVDGALPPTDVDGVVFDVDGCLTDGTLHYGTEGENTKVFHARDGMGMAMLRDAGVRMAVVSGRASPIIEARLRELGVTEFAYRRMDKRRAIGELSRRVELPAERMAAIGDDLVDVPMLRTVGFATAPSDADPRVQRVVHRVMASPGGRGAVRELAELVLRARGDWPDVVRRFELEADA